MKLVLLPGLDGTGELFEPFLAALDDVDSRVIRYPADRPMSYEEHAAHARESLPQDGPFVLLGESFSGPVAISLAAERPPGLRGVILCCSFASNPLPVFRPLGRLIGLAPAVKLPARWFAHWLYDGFATPELRRAHSRAMASVTAATLRARVVAVLAVDCREELRQIAVPMLYLQAKRDRLISRAALQDIRRYRSDIEIAAFDAPHFLLQARARECAAAVRGFLRKLPS